MSVVASEMVPDLPVIVVFPAFSSVVIPVLLMVATEVSEEVQPTSDVTSRVVPSLKNPVAENCWVVFRATNRRFLGRNFNRAERRCDYANRCRSADTTVKLGSPTDSKR